MCENYSIPIIASEILRPEHLEPTAMPHSSHLNHLFFPHSVVQFELQQGILIMMTCLTTCSS